MRVVCVCVCVWGSGQGQGNEELKRSREGVRGLDGGSYNGAGVRVRVDVDPGPQILHGLGPRRVPFRCNVLPMHCADRACALSLSRAALEAQINVIHASRASLGCRAHVRVLSPPPPPSTFSRLQRNIGKCQYHGGGRPPGTPPTQAQVVPLQVPGTLNCPGHWGTGPSNSRRPRIRRLGHGPESS